jgi:hypothetical protein
LEFERRSQQYLEEAQKSLLPEHADRFIAINMATGEYVLGDTSNEAFNKFLDRWPDNMMFLCRVDGGPAIKFHGR